MKKNKIEISNNMDCDSCEYCYTDQFGELCCKAVASDIPKDVRDCPITQNHNKQLSV